ncbi:MAG: alpha-ketoglutarate-dependent dioxygenase AlkB [Anaerolineae bacterium]|nr:alpha-ketoglutarate-dependent dioxygenase AlkB [Anaerolineae bacterium]
METQLLKMTDADVIFYPAYFTTAESDAYLDRLTANIAWEQQQLRLYGKTITVPRLTAWYGDPGMIYSYSGLTLHPHPWNDDLLVIRQRVEQVADVMFNSVLLNLYRDENDSVSWHSDDEPELGVNPVIASVSFGAVRRFQFKHKSLDERTNLELTHGSLLLMRGPTQHHWKHQLPKSKARFSPRLNLTFRVIAS